MQPELLYIMSVPNC